MRKVIRRKERRSKKKSNKQLAAKSLGDYVMLLSATSSTQNLNHPRTLLFKIPSPTCYRLSHLLLTTLLFTPYNPTTYPLLPYYLLLTTLLLTPKKETYVPSSIQRNRDKV